ncbi:sugar transporter [Piptocephalis cylindrospora]|uniref:Sugar transporter n=1 Tax=Piptocephalis cylindrospora TaxID=1907219 RepID=A0A4P9Y2I3_9FUNG|nr:sugar transporter [Piptocephalis cylindrospora]|eukprot:RKP12261.1 sugar transporter [Piptocephalis cylindrospora]
MSNSYLYLTVLVSAIGGLLFGYDIGVISGVLEMPRFKETFNWNSPLEKGFIVSSLHLGCLLGCIISSWMCDGLGRRWTIILGALVFCLGGAFQTLATSLPFLFSGRIISGIAIGTLSMAVPLFLAEIAPKHLRGRLVSCHQLAITIGILVSFCINFACSSIADDGSWRIPLAMQMVISALMAFGMLFLPASPRWLMSRGRVDQAATALRRIRGSAGPEVQQELDEVQDSIRLEREIGHGTWKECFSNGMWRRTLIGITLQAFQQLTGINAVLYYAPQIVRAAGFNNLQVALLATAGTGLINMCMTLPGIYLVDRVGRRVLLVSGGIMCALWMSLLGILMAVYGPTYDVKAVPFVCLAAVYLFTASFSYSWGPTSWVYPSELYPLRIRAKAMSMTTASNWLFNFLVAQAVPGLLQSIDWGLYLIFAGFGLGMALWVYFAVPETKGKSLEEVDALFGHSRPQHYTEAYMKQYIPIGGH